ncbi:argonaute family protein [Actinidia rufa]|uniref:Argonaute family protein n=1 Tax=Actinidia rufa TaxID=165716 RepID=A0A7J0H5H5_9ERIC|nr:argonaute family protein [Actinidia rufa]
MEEAEEPNTTKKCSPINTNYQHHQHLLQHSNRIGYFDQNHFQNYSTLLPLPPVLPLQITVTPTITQDQGFRSKTHLQKPPWKQNSPPLATSPDTDPTNPSVSSVARMIKQKMVEDNLVDLSGALPAYDGRKSLYSPIEFQSNSLEFFISLPIHSGKSLLSINSQEKHNRHKLFRINIKLVSKFDGKELSSYLSEETGDNWIPLPQDYLHALDIVLRESPMGKCIPVGQSLYSSSMGGAKDIGGGVVGLRGFFQSLRSTQQGLALNVDFSVTAFHESIGVIPYSQKRLKETVQRYRVYSLTEEATENLLFPDRDGKNLRLVSYFKDHYNYDIQFRNFPCLQVSRSKPCYLPMELCVICEGQKFLGKLSGDQTARILKMGCQRPRERKAIIDRVMTGPFGPKSGIQGSEIKIHISREMTQLNGRILQPPKLKLGDGGYLTDLIPSRYDRQWNLLESHVFEGTRIERWALISFGGSADQKSTISMFVNQLSQRQKGYADFKRIAETSVGVVSQCCLYQNLGKLSSQFLANLALKINAKVGRCTVALYNSLPSQIPRVFNPNDPVIFMGADVTHPHLLDDFSPSVAAVVGSINWPEANKYISRMNSQTHRQEIIKDLSTMVGEILDDFYQAQTRLPKRIVFFRDGVSETQFYKVLQEELQAIKAACSRFWSYKPPITFVVVQKRHHTRLFPNQNQVFDENIPPGTVVDTAITHPREFDFYLCSHWGVKGTSRPMHYHVLWDENQFTSDELQKLVYNLCFAFVRCTKPVSLVPPAYYAHLAAYRGRLYLERSDPSSPFMISGSTVSRTAPPKASPLPKLCENVKKLMFYC